MNIDDAFRMNALRPPCPTCGGDWEATWDQSDDCQFAQYGYPENCPDCVDGKVSIEQLVATYNAVHGEPPANAMRTSGYLLEYLMSVKP